MIGHTEKDLLKIEGIGVKAMDELKEGLKKKNLLHVIEDDLEATDDDVSSLLDMVFSPDGTVSGDNNNSFSADDESDNYADNDEDESVNENDIKSEDDDIEDNIDALIKSMGEDISISDDDFSDDILSEDEE